MANYDTPLNRITELLHARDLSQTRLAELVNTEPSTINKLIHGQRRLDQEWMRRLAPALGVTPAELLPREDNPLMLSDVERDLIERLRAASSEQRAMIGRIVIAALPGRADRDDAP